ncbi:MAG: hypothetical protein JWO59_2384, partial [Chloroflexi bacterium]|nr:hypothetical protein [Chloroflexota bacterium]
MLISIVIILAMILLLLPIAGVAGALRRSKEATKDSTALLMDTS